MAFFLGFAIFLVFAPSEGLRFYMSSNNVKCLKEEIHRNIVLTGEYEFSTALGHSATVHVCFFYYFQIDLYKVQTIIRFR